MDPSVALCAHLADPALGVLFVAPDDAIEWHDGPVLAVVRCTVCGGAGLIELLDWAEDGRLRVYALAGIDAAGVALHHRNVARGSCDLARRQRETEALVASAGPPARLVVRDNDTAAVVRSVAWPADRTMPADTWQERVHRRSRTLLDLADLELPPTAAPARARTSRKRGMRRG